MTTALPTLDDVLTFWFDETEPRQWWSRSDAFDRKIAARFGGGKELRSAVTELQRLLYTA